MLSSTVLREYLIHAKLSARQSISREKCVRRDAGINSENRKYGSLLSYSNIFYVLELMLASRFGNFPEALLIQHIRARESFFLSTRHTNILYITQKQLPSLVDPRIGDGGGCYYLWSLSIVNIGKVCYYFAVRKLPHIFRDVERRRLEVSVCVTKIGPIPQLCHAAPIF